MKKRLKVNGVIIFCAFLLMAASPSLFFRNEEASSLVFYQMTEIFGIAFILLGQILRSSSRGYKSEHSQGGAVLIQGGPYALVRNPMYLGILLIGLGAVLMLFKWWVALVFLAVFISRYASLILKEEKKLSVLFPEEFRDYEKKVPRILPLISAILQKDISEYLPLKLLWLKREVGSMLAVLFIVLLLKLLAKVKNQGAAVYLSQLLVFLGIIMLFVLLVIYLNKRTVFTGKNGSNQSKNTL